MRVSIEYMKYDYESETYIYRLNDLPSEARSHGIEILLLKQKESASLVFYSEQLQGEPAWEALFDAERGIANPLPYTFDEQDKELFVRFEK